jgi:plasmid segregation protein ParM
MNRQPKPLGLDLGFGFTKCIDGEQTVIFQSHMRQGNGPSDVATVPPAGTHHITLDDHDYIVGNGALGPSLFDDFARRPKRLIDTYGQRLVLTATAPFSRQEAPLHVVIGLPVAYFQQWATELATRLTGYHKIGIYQPDGRCARKNIHIRKVHVIPTPLGTFTGLIMDADGRRQTSEYDDLKIAVVDIGFRTTDILIMASGRFCNRGSGTIEMGMANGFERIADRLHRKAGEVPDFNRLYKSIRMGSIRIEDQEYNLTKLRDETYRDVSAALADRINYCLKDDWDIERILLTGGGAADAAETIAPLIDGEVVLIEHEQDVRLSNAQGQLCLARHMWGTSGFCHAG